MWLAWLPKLFYKTVVKKKIVQNSRVLVVLFEFEFVVVSVVLMVVVGVKAVVVEQALLLLLFLGGETVNQFHSYSCTI